MRRPGLVFSGQGAHKKGMGVKAVFGDTSAAATNTPSSASSKSFKNWSDADIRLRESYNFSISSVIRDNIPFINDAMMPTVAERVTHENPLEAPTFQLQPSRLAHEKGVMSITSLTQPAMLVASVGTFQKMEDVAGKDLVSSYSHIAGHSLGEWSALCAMGVVPMDIAAELVFLRGVLMEDALSLGSGKGDFTAKKATSGSHKLSYHLVAVNPKRAQLDSAPHDLLAVLVELIGRAMASTPHFIEIVNYNVHDEQYGVAGTAVALSVLGKCLDPHFRAQMVANDGASTPQDLVLVAMDEVLKDQGANVPLDPNKPRPKPKIAGVWDRSVRKIEGTSQQDDWTMDGGLTVPEEFLSHLTHIGDGRSGLKKKSWFIPVNVEVPFHSSLLRRAMDNFLPLVYQALPPSNAIEKVLFEDLANTSWITNLTGTKFQNTEQFRSEAIDAITSSNVGENAHSGKYTGNTQALVELVESKDTRKLLAAVMAAQVARPVQWSSVMDEFLNSSSCVNEVLEISPDPILSNMFKRAVAGKKAAITAEKEAAAAEGSAKHAVDIAVSMEADAVVSKLDAINFSRPVPPMV